MNKITLIYSRFLGDKRKFLPSYRIMLFCHVFAFPIFSLAQLSGTYTVGTFGGENYTSLTNVGGMFDAINTGGLNGDLTIEITSDLAAETGAVSLNQWVGVYSVSIAPRTASLKTITHSGCSDHLILLDDADNLTIDGRFAGGTTRYLRFVSSCSDKSVIKLEKDCENVTIRNCILSSDNNLSSVSTGGALHVDDNQVNGSDSLNILYNLFEDYSGAIDLFSAVQINAPSTAAGVLTGLVIEGNELSNVNGKGIYTIDQSGSINAAQIARNSFYANGTISGPGAGWAYASIQMESGSGHTIRANYLGGQGPLCSGSKMNFTLAATQSLIMIRMQSDLPTSTVNNIDSNVFRNLSISGSTTNPCLVSVMRIETSNCDIGVKDGNIIGNQTVDASTASAASIVMTENNNSTSNYFRVINSSSSGTINAENNKVGGILLQNNNTSGIRSYLMYSAGSSANFRNNTIGGSANNIVKKADGDFRMIYSNGDNSSFSISDNTISGITTSTDFDEDFYGIRVASGTGVPTISGNKVQNMLIGAVANQPVVYSIRSQNPNAVLDSNEVSNITIASAQSGVQFYGIHVSGTGSTFTLRDNKVSDISLTNTASVTASAIGIYTSGISTFVIDANFLDKFTLSSTSNSSYFRGIYINSATENRLVNNVILIDNGILTNDIYFYGIYDQASSGTNNIWHNTIDIRGTASGSRRSTCYYRTNGTILNIQNNIFNNRRTGGTGGHFAIYHNSTSGTITSNYNLLYVEENTSNLVRYSSNLDFAGWQALNYGANSVTITGSFELVNFTTGYQLTIWGNDIGNSGLGIAVDYLDSIRPKGGGFDMGAFEFVNSGLLPIELVSFKAFPIAGSVQLKWTTASEVNNDFYTIERSKEGRLWEKVTKVASARNSNILKHYSALDTMPYKGLSQYRLKQTDFNGQFSYSEIVVVDMGVIERDLTTIYPNPVTDGKVTISFGGSRASNFSIYDVLGKNMTGLAQVIGHNRDHIILDLHGFSSGVYFVAVKNEMNKIYIK